MTLPAQSAAGLARAMAGTALLAEVPPGAVGELVGAGTIRPYRRRTYLFHQGDEASSVYFLLQGRVEISSLSATGHRQLHATLDAPQFFGELGPLTKAPRTATAEALEDSRVWAAPADALLAFLVSQPKAAISLVESLARQLLAHEGIVEDLRFLDLKGRVAKRLLELAEAGGSEPPADGAVVARDMTHADLADLAGGSRENVSRILSEFKRRGLVRREKRRFVLLDVASLRRLAGL